MLKALPTEILDGVFDSALERTFAGLLPIVRTSFEAVCRTGEFPAGTTIYREGGLPRSFFLVLSGCAKICFCGAGGRKVIVRTAEAGAVLGLSSVLSGEPHHETAEVLTPLYAASVQTQDLHFLLQKHPELSGWVACQLVTELRLLVRNTKLLTLPADPSARLAYFLVTWVQAHAAAPATLRAPLPLKQEEIAEAVALTRGTVNRVLNQFERRGLICRRGVVVTILQLEVLRALANLELQ